MLFDLRAVTVAAASTLSSSQGLWLFLVVVGGVLGAGALVIIGRNVLKIGKATDQPPSLIRSWISISLVLGLLFFCAAAFLITDTSLRSALFGGLIASVGAAVAYYFSSASADKARTDVLNAALSTTQVSAPTTFSQADPPPGKVGAPYDYQFRAVGPGTLTFSLAPSSGPLPNGLDLDSTGSLRGIPQLAKAYTFSIAVGNEAGTLVSAPLVLLINP
jgi:Putative Ig domain